MTRSRFGFQVALLAGCLSLLAVGCGDDGTAMTPDPAGGNGEPVDPCAEDMASEACKEKQAKDLADAAAKKAAEEKAAREALPVFGLNEKRLLKTNELQIGANQILSTVATQPTAGQGTTSFFSYLGANQRAFGGINVVSNRPAALELETGAPFVVSTLDSRTVMRDSNGDLDYELKFFRYLNSSNDPGGADVTASRVNRGGYADTTPDMLDTVLINIPQVDASGSRANYRFSITPSDMINEELNLDYLASDEVGLGPDSMYEVHALEKDVTLNGTSGTLYVELLTDHDSRGTRDSDYLAGGVWMHIPEGDNTFTVGAFADGGQPFGVGITKYLFGTVTYEGKALGFHTMSGDSRMTQRLTGDVTLTANFGPEGNNNADPTVRGTLSGSIGNIKLDGMDPAGSSLIQLPVITMSAASGGSAGLADTDEFRSNPTVISLGAPQPVGQIGGQVYNGAWGAAFFGQGYGDYSTINTHDGTYGPVALRANKRPSGVAGLVKGTGGNNSAFVASFIAKD